MGWRLHALVDAATLGHEVAAPPREARLLAGLTGPGDSELSGEDEARADQPTDGGRGARARRLKAAAPSTTAPAATSKLAVPKPRAKPLWTR